MNRVWDRPVAIAAALVLVLGVTGAWVIDETRGTTLWFDEWLWALRCRDGLHAFIAPHNGHPTLIPFTIYRLLFATVGIDHSAPYRAIGIACRPVVMVVPYMYSAQGVGVGVLAAAVALALLAWRLWRTGTVSTRVFTAIELAVPASGRVLTARGRGASVSFCRFADGYPDDPLSRISPGGSGPLTICPDRSPRPWHVRVAPEGRLTACGAPS